VRMCRRCAMNRSSCASKARYFSAARRSSKPRPVKRWTRNPSAAATGVIKGAEVYVPLEGIIDLTQERDRLQKEIAKLSKDIEVFSKKLSNKNFVDKAPKEVVEKDTAKLEEFKAKRDKLEESLKMLV